MAYYKAETLLCQQSPSSQGYGFSSGHVWMCELDYNWALSTESWVLKNWHFWTVVLEKTLESPLDCKEIQPVILKEISPECSLEGLMLKLKLQYFSHLIQKADSLEKTLMLGKIEGGRRRDNRGWDGWMASLIQWTWVYMSKFWELVMDKEAWHAAVHGVVKSWPQPSDWTD